MGGHRPLWLLCCSQDQSGETGVTVQAGAAGAEGRVLPSVPCPGTPPPHLDTAAVVPAVLLARVP